LRNSSLTRSALSLGFLVFLPIAHGKAQEIPYFYGQLTPHCLRSDGMVDINGRKIDAFKFREEICTNSSGPLKQSCGTWDQFFSGHLPADHVEILKTFTREGNFTLGTGGSVHSLYALNTSGKIAYIAGAIWPRGTDGWPQGDVNDKGEYPDFDNQAKSQKEVNEKANIQRNKESKWLERNDFIKNMTNFYYGDVDPNREKLCNLAFGTLKEPITGDPIKINTGNINFTNDGAVYWGPLVNASRIVSGKERLTLAFAKFTQVPLNECDAVLTVVRTTPDLPDECSPLQ
jgi:hypothetical protein